MARHRTHSIEFKRQIAQDYLAGETLHSLARRHDLSRNLVRIWIQKFEAGAFDDEAIAADTIEAYEARIAALERLVGRQTLEIEFLKGALSTHPEREAQLRPSSPAPRHLHRRRMPADGDRALHLLRSARG
ncbi:transposase [Bosea sp. AK1]|uniref:transposase n=1 Tax=Bosea sp. AK1 TaxID=2587160 RepID=UPI00116DADC8|nr:transposase [Bosea sp. AK1]TQI65209.1 transposase [Bosea sp. AK1]